MTMPVFVVDVKKTLLGGTIVAAATREEAEQLALKLPTHEVCWDDPLEIEVVCCDLLTDLVNR
jgi:hypothetical protein